MPSRGDSDKLSRDTLALVEELSHAVAELGAQLAELRDAVSPRRSPTSARRRRRGDTFLHVVKAAVIAAVSLAAVVALMHPLRVRDQRYPPRCTVACSRPVAHRAPAP